MNGGHKKTCKEKKPCGENVRRKSGFELRLKLQEMRSPSCKGFTKKEIKTADPTKLKAWYLEKKELNKEKLNEWLVLKPR